MSGLYKDKLVFDATSPADTDNVGAFLRASDGTLLTHTAGALNVNVGNTVTVSATDLDIRNLSSGQDSVTAIQGTSPWVISGTVTSDMAFDYAEDTAHTTGDVGAFMLAVRNDTEGSLVSADGDYAPLQVDSLGRLRVFADLSTTSSSEKAEDNAHTTADIGSFVLAVRQDTLATSVDTDGDYGAFKFNNRGAQWVAPVGTAADDAADTENPVKVGSRARIGTLAAISADGDRADLLSDKYRRVYINEAANISIVNTQVDVDDTTDVSLVTAAPGRKRILVQNLGTKAIFLGATGVTSADGLRVAAGATSVMELGEHVALFARADSGTQDVRVLELA